MEYRKIKRDNYNIHIINTNRFKAINVDVYFARKFDKTSIPFDMMLNKCMAYSTKKYNNFNKFVKKLEDLYGFECFISTNYIAEVYYRCFSFEFINPKYAEEKDFLNASMNFINEIIFNPNIVNSKFDETIFNMCKEEVIGAINSEKDNPTSYSFGKFIKLMYKESPYEYTGLPTIEELNKVTSSALVKYYSSLFTDYEINIIVTGEIADDDIIKYIDKMFCDVKSKPFKAKAYLDFKDVKLNKCEDILKFSQSQLRMGYVIKNPTEYERRYVLNVYNVILGVMNNNLLFEEVREKNSMCYSVNSMSNPFCPSIRIHSAINKMNKDAVIDLIKNCMKKMGDEKEISSRIELAKKSINTYYNAYYDDVSSIIERYFGSLYANTPDIEESREKIMKVSTQDIVNLNKKVKLSTIYFLKGDI